jgi:hypothetical protein
LGQILDLMLPADLQGGEETTLQVRLSSFKQKMKFFKQSL